MGTRHVATFGAIFPTDPDDVSQSTIKSHHCWHCDVWDRKFTCEHV